ncbi:MAG TPA: NADH-quinone oxidoreductase subunit J/K [Cytophagales bacterium]|jgi:NADP-reducing hydrogenase subunit HndC|nr:NADH-quinone oxidoreductase subunit J/K [Cytophagales bacterium]
MEKLTLKTTQRYREQQRAVIEKRLKPDQLTGGQMEVMVCRSTGCESIEAKRILERLKKVVNSKGLDDKIHITQTGCFGFCEKGPIVKVLPENVYYVMVKPDDIEEIVEKHFVEGNIVDSMLMEEQQGKTGRREEISLFKKQMRIVLRNNGRIDPESVNEYIAVDGYTALEKVLNGMTPEEVIATLKLAGLRGRGGAGFPIWQKWTNARKAIGENKFIICNGDEGDPGAFMDSSVLEGDPHSVIEAMAIAAYTIGASKGYFYVRAEYGLAIRRIQVAIDQAYALGLLGKNVLGSDFSFDLEIRLGAGAFVCGEETALIASIEGERGTPRPRPPYPSISGLFGMPTVINNVETLANIAPIINNGGEWFASIGTETSKGTKVFALTGKVNVSGLIEVPMGTTIREIVFDIGGGIAGGKKVKAVQTGGPSGGIIPEKYFDTPIDYESLNSLGSMMGSGGMIVMDEDDSMVDIAKFYIQFSVDESCGKCAPCRIGNYQILQILERFGKKRGKEDDLEKLHDIAFAMKKGSLCGLGQTSPNPVISTLKYFPEEYNEKIRKPKIVQTK